MRDRFNQVFSIVEGGIGIFWLGWGGLVYLNTVPIRRIAPQIAQFWVMVNYSLILLFLLVSLVLMISKRGQDFFRENMPLRIIFLLVSYGIGLILSCWLSMIPLWKVADQVGN